MSDTHQAGTFGGTFARNPRSHFGRPVLPRLVRPLALGLLLVGPFAPGLQADLAFEESPEARRMIITGTAPLLRYVFSNSSASDLTYSVSGPGFSHVNDLGLGTIFGHSTGIITVRPDLAGVTPGTTLTPGITITPSEGSPISSSVQIQAIQNRPLTGSLQVDAGRFMVGSDLGSLVVSGGSLANNAATWVATTGNRFQFQEAYYGSYAYLYHGDSHGSWDRYGALGSSGQDLVLSRTPGTPRSVLDGPGQSVTYQASFSTTGQKNVALSGQDFAVMFSGESLPNAALDLAGVSVEINGTSVTNRRFAISQEGSPESFYNDGFAFGESANGLVIDLGRRMVNDGNSYSYTTGAALELASGQGDDYATRVRLGAGTVSSNGVTLTSLDETLFDNATATAAIGMTADVTFDGTTAGRQLHSANLAGLMVSGEEGGALLPGQSIADVKAGVALSVVQDRVVTAEDVTIKALTGSTVTTVRNLINSSGSDDSYTRVSVLGQQLRGNNSVSDVYTLDQAVTGGSVGVTQLVETRTLEITGEGLDGEQAQASVSYDVSTRFYNRSSVAFQQNAGGSSYETARHLGEGSIITYSISEGENIATAAGGLYLAGGYGFFSLDNISTEPGQYSYAIDFAPRGGAVRLGGTFTATLVGVFEHTSDFVGAESADLGTYYWTLSHTIARPTSSSGTIDAGAGTRLQNVGITYGESTFSNPTNVDILDSDPLSGNRTIDINFSGADAASGLGSDKLSSDVASVHGLDGELFVLQMNYDEAFAIAEFGSELATVLLWFDTENASWVNAVLGNSDEGAGARRFAMSYADYLLQEAIAGQPLLSHFGIDITTNTVWAVLDHNSDFGSGVAVVPEPSTWALLALAGCFLVFHLRRRVRLRTTSL